MSNDPAVLFFPDKWMMATAEMDSDVRGWYLNLILHQYDKKDLPNDVEKLALLAGVKFSEFERFKQMYNQVLKQKFVQNDSGRLSNEVANQILRSRQDFKEKRTRSANIGVVIKAAMKLVGNNDSILKQFKKYLFSLSDEEIEKQKSNQVLKQTLKLYINENENENVITNNVLEGSGEPFTKEHAKDILLNNPNQDITFVSFKATSYYAEVVQAYRQVFAARNHGAEPTFGRFDPQDLNSIALRLITHMTAQKEKIASDTVQDRAVRLFEAAAAQEGEFFKFIPSSIEKKFDTIIHSKNGKNGKHAVGAGERSFGSM